MLRLGPQPESFVRIVRGCDYFWGAVAVKAKPTASGAVEPIWRAPPVF